MRIKRTKYYITESGVRIGPTEDEIHPKRHDYDVTNPYAVAYSKNKQTGIPDGNKDKIENAPPGREAQVARFKKIYKGDEARAYAAAWASYKKSKLGSPQNDRLKGSGTRSKGTIKKKIKSAVKNKRNRDAKR